MIDFDNLDDWRENYFNKLRYCREDMVTDISMSKSYDGGTFKAYMKELIGTHGKDCVSLLLSYTIRSAEGDGRYDPDVKAWAKSYPEIVQPPISTYKKVTFNSLLLNEHSCILNQAARIAMSMDKSILPVRKDMERC